MKIKPVILLILVILFTTFLFGCGQKDNISVKSEVENKDKITVVTLNDKELEKALTHDTYKILQDYTDEYYIIYEYITDASYEDIREYYLGLIENTEEYNKIEPAGDIRLTIQGTINETIVYIEIDNSDPGKVRVNSILDLTTK